MSVLTTFTREQAPDLWPLEREYQPLPAEACGCQRPIPELWHGPPGGHRCVKCGRDLLPGVTAC